MRGILDRFEDNNKAVILIEETKEEVVIPVDELPDGSSENTYFNMEKIDDKYQIVSIDEATTQKEAEETSDLMAKLRAKSKGSKFKKK
ncbi:Protein of unknown function [Virgibacillus subterraneus]|uniref:DUF3006 domain-containing protein n=1 Tax=Virgibacillus subterraneus TaxID=621109 RepID=A0A1H9B3E9_9BACI|nr:DUF3006 domain-containing protein [Virgibacillus subterraneus]SEP83257.1 Protein of unknown function [Virgibacillus subterraneus]